jgi:hypothetical protein
VLYESGQLTFGGYGSLSEHRLVLVCKRGRFTPFLLLCQRVFRFYQGNVKIVRGAIPKEVFPDLIYIHYWNDILILTESVTISKLLVFGEVDQILIRVESHGLYFLLCRFLRLRLSFFIWFCSVNLRLRLGLLFFSQWLFS